MHSLDEELMALALAEAKQGLAVNEVPIGAVAALDGDALASAHWRLRPHFRLLDHPEVLVLRAAEVRRLTGPDRARVTLYTTLEPCLLCMGAAMSFMAGRIVFALEAPLDGASDVADAWQPVFGYPTDGFPYAVPEVVGGVRRQYSLALMQEFVSTHPESRWASALLPPSAG